MLSTGTKKGWYPGAEQIATGAFWVGNEGRKAVVLHVVEGTYLGAVSVFAGEDAKKSAHFLLARTGHVAQFVSIYDSAWANGLSYKNGHWIDPTGRAVTPPWPGLTPPTNPNKITVSIEEEGKHNKARTLAQYAARIAVLRWVAAQFTTALSPYTPGVTLIGHKDISPVERANCPGPFVDFAATAKDANGPAPARHYEIIAPCAVLTNRAPDASLASGPDDGQTRLGVGTRINVGDVTAGWLWIAPNTTDAPGIGFIPAAYARPL
jgi:N-acetylmuramoyl-L-alanine amidase-like protein